MPLPSWVFVKAAMKGMASEICWSCHGLKFSPLNLKAFFSFKYGGLMSKEMPPTQSTCPLSTKNSVEHPDENNKPKPKPKAKVQNRLGYLCLRFT